MEELVAYIDVHGKCKHIAYDHYENDATYEPKLLPCAEKTRIDFPPLRLVASFDPSPSLRLSAFYMNRGDREA
jgi:hypothetical protein